MRNAPLESEIQRAFIQWVRIKARSDERYLLIASVPNGAHLARGARSYNNLHSQGLSPGYPDIIVDYPAHGFHGLRIEFKRKTGKQSEDQKLWELLLNKYGFKYELVRSVEQAILLLEMWIENK